MSILIRKIYGRIGTLRAQWFEGDTVRIARELLGMTLVRLWRGRRMEATIVETEAYDGPHDKASHASRGRTTRNAVMFGPPGRWYVYLCYGVHSMLNVVTGPEGYPAAVLIRATSDAHGPGLVTRSMHITRAQNGRMASPRSDLWIENGVVRVKAADIVAAPRVGVDYAAQWREAPYRFILKTV